MTRHSAELIFLRELGEAGAEDGVTREIHTANALGLADVEASVLRSFDAIEPGLRSNLETCSFDRRQERFGWNVVDVLTHLSPLNSANVLDWKPIQ